MSRSKKKPSIYTSPGVFMGELIAWKGYFWRVQAFSPNGGEVELKDENGTQRAVAVNACLFLEMSNETTGSAKRRDKATKHPLKPRTPGFREVVDLSKKKEKDIEKPKSDIIAIPSEQEVRAHG